MLEGPDYSAYSFRELHEALNGIDTKRFPERAEHIEQEIRARQIPELGELFDCYHYLDKEKWPSHADHLRELILAQETQRRAAAEPRIQVNLNVLKYKTYWRRVLAGIVDLLVLALPIAPMIFLSVQQLRSDIYSLLILSLIIASAVLPYVYSILMHGSRGQTLGKILCGVKLWGRSEDPLRPRQAILRDLVPLVLVIAGSLLLVYWTRAPELTTEDFERLTMTVFALVAVAPFWYLIEILTMLTNRKRRALHDFLAQSIVLRLPSKVKDEQDS